jgi:hypothetical protein
LKLRLRLSNSQSLKLFKVYLTFESDKQFQNSFETIPEGIEGIQATLFFFG